MNSTWPEWKVKLRQVINSPYVLEVVLGVISILVLSAGVYIIFGPAEAIISFAGLQLVLLFLLQVRWEYRSQQNSKNTQPVRTSLVKVVFSFTVAGVLFILTLYVNQFVYTQTGVSILYPLAVIGFLSYIGYTIYKVDDIDVSDDR